MFSGSDQEISSHPSPPAIRDRDLVSPAFWRPSRSEEMLNPPASQSDAFQLWLTRKKSDELNPTVVEECKKAAMLNYQVAVDGTRRDGIDEGVLSSNVDHYDYGFVCASVINSNINN